MVDYNPDIQQILDVQVAETLTCGSAVRRVKFSRNGKYLAVGLESGETHIYDLKTLSKRLDFATMLDPAVLAN
jgi:WD40 repeat protein